MTEKPAIRLLSTHDACAYTEHLQRIIASSGVGATPLFTVRAANEPFNFAERLEKVKQEFAATIDDLVWRRCFALTLHDGGVVGTCDLFSRGLITMKHRAFLALGIETAYRGLGLGKVLLNTAIEWAAKSTNLAWIDLGVFAHNAAARRLYQSVGFYETGRVTDFARINGHVVDDIQMTLDLRQWR